VPSGRGPPWPPRRLRPSPVPWLHGAGGPTGATVGPRPPYPPPSAIGRPIELFVHPATASMSAGRHHSSARTALSHSLYRPLAILLLLLLLFFSCSSLLLLHLNTSRSTPPPPLHNRLLFTNAYTYYIDRYVCG